MASAVAQLGLKTYVRYRNTGWFLGRAKNAEERKLRRQLLAEFRQVERKVHSVHAEREMLFMVDYLLTNATAGPMVECGCYHGGSSAKLSLVARTLDKRLYVCDSFRGLPPVAGDDGVYHSVDGEVVQFTEGEYAVGMEKVQANIRRAGDISRCEFVPGFFSDSLPGLDISPCFVFMDVDLISSARDVIRYLWPSLKPGGRFFTHEAIHPEFIMGIMDPCFWGQELGEAPPTIFGAGFGCGFNAGGIAYFDKGK
jgi:hypothetical protein